jgi:CDP-paratose 2-epimerase
MTMSLLELLEILDEVTGAPIPVTYGDWRPGDQRVYVSDIAKASNTFGWQPKIAPRDGVKSLHAWVVENREMLESVL